MTNSNICEIASDCDHPSACMRNSSVLFEDAKLSIWSPRVKGGRPRICPWRKRRPAPRRFWRQTLVLHAVAVTHDPWLCIPLSTKTESRSRSLVSWSVRSCCVPVVQIAPSSSCGTSPYPLVRRKYTPFLTDWMECSHEKPGKSESEADSDLSSVDKMEN